jgi:translocation and assembly module TamB
LGRGGKIQFRSNTFIITSGYVEYKNSPPENPYLNLSAESRVTAEFRSDRPEDSIKREYDVVMRVTGLASNPNVSVSSQPALSEAQLISLLTLGFISETERPSTNQDDSVANTSYQLGSAFINEQLGLSRGIGKTIGVEFDISSGYDSADKAAVHTFSVKKQWSPKFGTSASRSVGKTSTNNVRAEYKLNPNLSVIGSYVGKEQSGASSSETLSNETPNLFGLDVEYRVDFK